MKTSAKRSRVGRLGIFQQDNDSKVKSEGMVTWLQRNGEFWPSVNPYLNLIEFFLAKMQIYVQQRDPNESSFNNGEISLRMQ